MKIVRRNNDQSALIEVFYWDAKLIADMAKLAAGNNDCNASLYEVNAAFFTLLAQTLREDEFIGRQFNPKRSNGPDVRNVRKCHA